MIQQQRTCLRLGGAAALLLSGALAGCEGGEPPAAATAPAARVYAAAPGQVLTAPSQALPRDIVARFLRGHGLGGAEGQLRLAAEERRGGLVHLRLEQELGGLRVASAYVKATLGERGELRHLIERLAPLTGTPSPAAVPPREALAAALSALGHAPPAAPAELGTSGNSTAFERGTFFHSEPQVERVVVQGPGGQPQVGFEVQTWSRVGNQLHRTLVDGAGQVLSIESRTQRDSYKIFPEDPLKGAQTVVQGPGAGNGESPAGWLAGTQSTANISGNNVNAYLDTDANNRADRGGAAVTSGDFLATADLASAPSTPGNRAVAVQNLFYLNNVVHDVLYRNGFDEAAGNFQGSNFGKGGVGGDAVLAEVQDGGGLDNANFATPPDGQRPRMQMYLWTGVGPSHEVLQGGGVYPAHGAAFGKEFSTGGVTAPLAVMSPADGCTAAAAGLSGKIAIIDRGACNFDIKVKNAQSAGAVAAIIANHAAGGDEYFPMAAGTAKNVRIPALMVGYGSGLTLKAAAGAAATARRKAVQPLQIDASLDADIVFHEYGHGLSWRRIGGMSGPLSGAIGEGASDVLAFLLNGDDRVGEYAQSDPRGIRRAPYSGYPRRYGDVTGAEVHDDGEIYAGAMWRLKELYEASGLGATDLLRDFVGGMSYTPASPAFEDMRDGMLAHDAAANQGARRCLIWRAFADFAIGVGAHGEVSGAGVSITPSTALPPDCAP